MGGKGGGYGMKTATGLLEGLVKAKLIKHQEGLAMEELELKKDTLKAETKYKEKILEMTARGLAIKEKTPAEKIKEIMDLLGGGAASQSTKVPLPNYEPGSGMPPFRPGGTMDVPLPQQIAQGNMGELGLSREDLIRGVIKKELGAEAPKYNRTAPVIMPDGRPGMAPMNDRGLIDLSKAVASPVKYEGVNVTTPTGAPGRQWIDPYNPPRGIAQTGPAEVDFRATTDLSGNEWEIPYVKGTAIPAVDAKPRLKNPTGLLKPMNPQDLANWRHKETGEHPPPGIKPADLASKGYVPVSSGEETRAMSMEAADAIIGRIDGLADKVFVAEGIGARAASGPKKKFSYWLGTDPDLDLYESLKSGLMANIARTFGERGTLTDRDIDRIQKLFPVAVPTFGRPLPDSRTVAKRKLGEIKDIIAEISKRKPKAGGRGPSLDLGGGNSAKPKTWEELKAGAK